MEVIKITAIVGLIVCAALSLIRGEVSGALGWGVAAFASYRLYQCECENESRG